MNIGTTTYSPAAQTTGTFAGTPASTDATAEVAAQPKDSVEFRLQIPQSINVDLVKYAKYAGRIAPGMLSLGLNAPAVVISPVFNAIGPARSKTSQHTYEIWANVLGTGAIGAAVGGFIGAANGHQILGSVMGTIAGGLAGLTRAGIAGKAKYPEIADVAAQAKDSHTNKSFSAGVALRQGYATAIKEAYMDGGKYADSTVDFMRGLVGLKAD